MPQRPLIVGMMRRTARADDVLPALSLRGLGPLNSWYAEAGGPLALWGSWSDDVQGGPLNAGHFFPEEMPSETADALDRFFAASS